MLEWRSATQLPTAPGVAGDRHDRAARDALDHGVRLPGPPADNRVITLTQRPAVVKEVIEVDVPAERDYSATMARPEFATTTSHIRDLLGAATGHD